MALAYNGRTAEAERNTHFSPKDRARKLIREREAQWRRENVRPIDVARAYAVITEPKPALDALERAYADRDPQIVWMKVDPRFATLLSKLKLAPAP
jgi:hypothetical protein